jgi:3-phenylpropionate/cinnamic acid dioxygenase small subunit
MAAPSVAGPAPIEDPKLARELEQFLFEEAALLDAGRFEDWLACFAADGRYWVPAELDADDPDETIAIFDEDRALLAVRIDRLRRPNAYAFEPPPRTVHIVSNVQCWRDGAAYVTRSKLLMAEYRNETRRYFAATVTHRLVREAGTLRIALKRVDLIDCDATHEFMTVPF